MLTIGRTALQNNAKNKTLVLR